MRRALLPLAALCLLATGARPTAACSGDYCGTLVFVAGGQPDILLPPVSVSALARDIHDQIFLKLADIGMALNTVGDRGFVPQLAKRWEWRDPLTLVFHLDARALARRTARDRRRRGVHVPGLHRSPGQFVVGADPRPHHER